VYRAALGWTPREMEALIQRLVANPGDGEALAYAHQAGTQDPRAYAILLEKVGMATPTPAVAAHWLGEAANVWSQTLGDAHHAARTLMAAIERDPTQRSAAERLASLYREKGDQRALVALLERRVKALAPLEGEPDARAQLVEAHEELGKLWGEPPLLRPERAVENYRRLVELDPRHVYGIYALRELLKAQQQYGEALPFFAMEHALVDDPERRLALYRDEADLRRRIDDWAGAAQALRNALSMRPDDPALSQELGLLLLEQLDASRGGDAERNEAAQIFVRLAESYDGEYAYSYSASALRAQPGHDRAMQLADYWGKQQGRLQELKPLYTAYLQANPNGFMAGEARKVVGSVPPPPPPPRAPMPLGGASRPDPARARRRAAGAARARGRAPGRSGRAAGPRAVGAAGRRSLGAAGRRAAARVGQRARPAARRGAGRRAEGSQAAGPAEVS
jgi:tetratricopeptide (TPR) repeat protein